MLLTFKRVLKEILHRVEGFAIRGFTVFFLSEVRYCEETQCGFLIGQANMEGVITIGPVEILAVPQEIGQGFLGQRERLLQGAPIHQ